MSVVNKMLKDLEKREAAKAQSADYVPTKVKKDRTNLIVALLVIALVGLGAVLVYVTDKNRSNKSKTEADSIAQQPATVVVTPSAQASLPPSNAQSDEMPADAISSGDVIIELDQEDIAALKARLNKPISQPDSLGQDIEASTAPSIEEPPVAAPEPAQAEPPKTMKVSSSVGSPLPLKAMQNQVNKAVQSGDTTAAIEQLQVMVSAAPRDVGVQKQLASLHFANGDSESAEQVLVNSIRLAPQDSSLRLMQARLLYKQGHHGRALDILLKHPQDVPAADDLLSFRAALAEKEGEYQVAASDYQALLERQPQSAKWWLGLAVSQDKQGLFPAALLAYRNVKGIDQLSEQVMAFVDQRIAILEKRVP